MFRYTFWFDNGEMIQFNAVDFMAACKKLNRLNYSALEIRSVEEQ